MNKQDYETRLSQLEIDVRQLRQLLKTPATGDNEGKPEEPVKRKPGRKPNAERKDPSSSD